MKFWITIMFAILESAWYHLMVKILDITGIGSSIWIPHKIWNYSVTNPSLGDSLQLCTYSKQRPKYVKLESLLKCRPSSASTNAVCFLSHKLDFGSHAFSLKWNEATFLWVHCVNRIGFLCFNLQVGRREESWGQNKSRLTNFHDNNCLLSCHYAKLWVTTGFCQGNEIIIYK